MRCNSNFITLDLMTMMMESHDCLVFPIFAVLAGLVLAVASVRTESVFVCVCLEAVFYVQSAVCQ